MLEDTAERKKGTKVRVTVWNKIPDEDEPLPNRKWKNAAKNAALRKRLETEEVEPCNHSMKKIVAGCLFCFSKSHASLEKSDYWSNQNKVGPEQVFKRCGKKFIFNCDKCDHSFEKTADKIAIGVWCAFCQHKALCENNRCNSCHQNSFASHEKASLWSKKNKIFPRAVFKSSNKIFWFDCDRCNHCFEAALNNVTAGKFCPFCGHRKLCDDQGCESCRENSFESHEKAIFWSKRNEKSPREIFKSSTKKFWFDCGECGHSFQIALSNIRSNNSWCCYCSHNRLCGGECELCWKNSFASSEKVLCWDIEKNKKSPRDVFKQSEDKFWFICHECNHSFDASLGHVTEGNWCPFCSHKRLCLEDCNMCHSNSFASHPKVKYWSEKNNSDPRNVFKCCNIKYWFDCKKCGHCFDMTPGEINRGSWCRFCAGKICGEESCTICVKPCEACLTNKAKKQTLKSRLKLCAKCFDRCIKEHPEETPLRYRAKVTLEIYTLAELQRRALEVEASFLLSEATVWDCPIFPGSNRKPDNAWIFDDDGNALITAGACKINKGDISYVLILEILEHGISRHSKQRDISDKEREREIRNVFAHVPVGFVYVTVAHTEHRGASKKDIFFSKNANGEYEVLENRKEAWEKRIDKVRDKLVKMFCNKDNSTYYIGN